MALALIPFASFCRHPVCQPSAPVTVRADNQRRKSVAGKNGLFAPKGISCGHILRLETHFHLIPHWERKCRRPQSTSKRHSVFETVRPNDPIRSVSFLQSGRWRPQPTDPDRSSKRSLHSRHSRARPVILNVGRQEVMGLTELDA